MVLIPIIKAIMSLSAFSALAANTAGFDHTHKQWTKILNQYVQIKGAHSGVKYSELAKSPSELKKYTKAIQSVSKDEYNTFSLDEKLAFLINAYNALTIELIVDNWKVSTIKDIGSVLSPPWKKRFFTLLEEREHLDGIEHQLIEKNFTDPRVHFALVCASKGCPPLRNEAYEGSRLNHQLEEVTQGFLRDKVRNHFDPKSNTLFLSSIFKWYSKSFEDKYGSLQAFVGPRIASSPEEQRIIEDKKTKIKHLDFDWSLNEAAAL